MTNYEFVKREKRKLEAAKRLIMYQMISKKRKGEK